MLVKILLLTLIPSLRISMNGRKFDLWMPFLYRSVGGLLLVAIRMTPLSNK